MPFQCLRVGAKLNLTNKFTENAMSGLMHRARYNKALIAFKHSIFGPNISSSSYFGQNRSLLGLRDRTIIEVLSG